MRERLGKDDPTGIHWPEQGSILAPKHAARERLHTPSTSGVPLPSLPERARVPYLDAEAIARPDELTGRRYTLLTHGSLVEHGELHCHSWVRITAVQQVWKWPRAEGILRLLSIKPGPRFDPYVLGHSQEPVQRYKHTEGDGCSYGRFQYSNVELVKCGDMGKGVQHRGTEP